MFSPSILKALPCLALAVALAGLLGCSPPEPPASSLYWQAPVPGASTDSVQPAKVVYIGDLFAEAEQGLQHGSDRAEPIASF